MASQTFTCADCNVPSSTLMGMHQNIHREIHLIVQDWHKVLRVMTFFFIRASINKSKDIRFHGILCLSSVFHIPSPCWIVCCLRSWLLFSELTNCISPSSLPLWTSLLYTFHLTLIAVLYILLMTNVAFIITHSSYIMANSGNPLTTWNFIRMRIEKSLQ